MNKLSKLVLGVAVSAMVLSGCRNQEVVAPSVTNPNQFPNGVITKKVTVSIQVTGSSENGRTEGLTGAQVIIAQNGNSSSKTVDKDGIAIFTDLNPGDFRYFVSNSGYASYNGNGAAADASGALIGATGNNSNQTVLSNNQLKVVLPRIGAKLAGKYFTNDDLDATTPTKPIANVRVRLVYPDAYQPNLYYTTTNAQGEFAFANVLETKNVANGVPMVASITVDTAYTLLNERIVLKNETVVTDNIRFGATGLQANVGVDPAAATTNIVVTGGTVRIKPFGNFDFLTRTTSGSSLPITYENEADFTVSSSSKLNSTSTKGDAVVKLVYNAANLPAGLATEYTGVQDANGIYTFSNVPVSKNGVALQFDVVVTQTVLLKVGYVSTTGAGTPTECAALDAVNGNNTRVNGTAAPAINVAPGAGIVVVPGVHGGAAFGPIGYTQAAPVPPATVGVVSISNYNGICPNGASQNGYNKEVVYIAKNAATTLKAQTLDLTTKVKDFGIQELVAQ